MERSNAAHSTAASVVLLDLAAQAFLPASWYTGSVGVTRVHNTGGLFGLFQDTNTVFIALTIAVIAGLVVYRDRLPWPSYGLVLGGGVSNLADRAINGHVVDYFDISVWPVFNVADAAIVLGAAIMVYTEYDGRRASREEKYVEDEKEA